MQAPPPHCLEVLTPGLLTTVQDLGRPGYTDLGLPIAGAVDPLALMIANVLAGNDPGAPALEITISGPELLVLDACAIALAGADFGARIDGERRLAPGGSYLLRAGSTLSFGSPAAGARAYLALAGGIAAPRVLGSASTYLAGGLGGLDGSGRPLRPGDLIAPARLLDPLCAAGRFWPGSAPTHSNVVRVIAGPHPSYFTAEALDELCSATWTVSDKSDRMGLRLLGGGIGRQATSGELLSQGVVRGAIQVPADGLPIVLLADHQTTGGYPVLGAVASADWPVLAQLPPGGRLRFAIAGLEEAQAAYRRQQRDFAVAAARLRLQATDAGIDWLEVAGWS